MDEQLAGLIEDLRGAHRGIDLILDGYQAIADDAPSLSRDQAMTLLYCLAGSQGGDLIALNGLAVRDLTRRTPAVDQLGDEPRKKVLAAGELVERDSYFQDRTDVTNVIAALEAGGR